MNRIIILLTVLIFISTTSLTNAQYLQDLSLHKNITGIADSNRQTQSKNIKSPVLAGVLSFAFPGLAFGQLYNNQPGKFVIHTCVTGICAAVGAIGLANLNIDVGGGGDGDAFGGWVFLFAAAVFAGNWTWSVVDAVVTANNINKQVKMQKYRSGVLDKLKFGFSVDKNKQLNLKFALEL